MSVLTSKPWCTSFVMAPEGHPFYAATKRGRLGHGSKRADWPLSKGKAGGKVGAWMPGMLSDTG